MQINIYVYSTQNQIMLTNDFETVNLYFLFVRMFTYSYLQVSVLSYFFLKNTNLKFKYEVRNAHNGLQVVWVV